MGRWRRLRNALRPRLPGPQTEFSSEMPVYRRFLSDQDTDFEQYIQHARDYPRAIGLHDFMYAKPFGELDYYSLLMYNFLNLLKVMDLPGGARILEVGSGPGWITELPGGLGYHVEAIEPAEDFAALGRERVQAFIADHRLAHPPRVNFHNTTLEECDLPDNSFDGVLFFDALHHIVDEARGIAKCFRLLREDGVLGVSEAAWIPGDEALESKIKDEMAKYGTLENPFSAAYLDYVLTQNGFIEITRYHQINGLIPVEQGNMPVIQLAQARAEGSNTLTARKPVGYKPNTLDPDVETTAIISVVDTTLDPDTRKLALNVKLTNTGKSAWLSKPRTAGGITVALYRGDLGTESFDEALPRQYIARDVLPGDTLETRFEYVLPESLRQGIWRLDMVNEGHFWFSQRGTKNCVVDIP